MAERVLRAVYKRRELIKYVLSGGTAAFVDLFLLYILTSLLGVWYLLSAVFAFIGAFFVSFYLQKFWTFRDGDRLKMKRQMIQYFSIGVTNLGINTLGMYLAVDIFHVWYLAAQFLVSILIALESFLVYKYLIFIGRERPKEARQNSPIKKILIATGIYPPDYRGPATLLESLPEALRKKGFEIKIITYSDVPVSGAEEGWVFRINKKRPGLIKHLLFLLKLWELSRWADLIYATDIYSVGYFTYLVSHLRGKKYLLRFTGDSAWETARLKGWVSDNIIDFQKNSYSSAIEKAKNKRKKIIINAEKIIVDCRSGAELAKLIGAEEERIQVIYNSLDTSKFNTSREKVELIRLEYGANAKIIVTAGQLNPWKGFDGVIKIMPRLVEKLGEGTKLIILGEGPEKESLAALAAKLGVSSNVLFLGKIAHSEITNYLSAADLFILNSDYEGLSHLILEAMLAGSPIIVSNSGGNKELIDDNKNGLVVNYNNPEELYEAALKMLNNKELAQEMAKNAKEKSGQFKWENVVSETVKVIEEC